MSGVCHWFTGVIEDIHDPEKMNRVKVRIHGLHSDKIELDESSGQGMSTDELPWAYVAMPTIGAGMHGFGQSPHGLVEGSWVLGISRDGPNYNELIVTHSLLGIPTIENPNDAEPKTAFFGMDGLWPDKEFLDEPDVHRLARGTLEYKDEKWKPIPKIKEDERITGIPQIHSTWDEKEHAYGAEYPYNQVLFNGPSRTTLEIDETEGAERIAWWHGPSHTYGEIQPDGSIQTRTVGDNYQIVQKDNNLYVQGEINITVVGNANLLSTEGDINVQADKGDINVEAIEGEINLTAKQDINLKGDSDISLDAKGNIDLTAKKDISVKAEGDVKIESEKGNIEIESFKGEIGVTTKLGNIEIDSGIGQINCKGAVMNINTLVFNVNSPSINGVVPT